METCPVHRSPNRLLNQKIDSPIEITAAGDDALDWIYGDRRWNNRDSTGTTRATGRLLGYRDFYSLEDALN